MLPQPKPQDKQVVIIGGGPAGMTLAYLLVTNGVPVRVVERHADFKREFRGEGIQPSVMKVLAELELLPELLARGSAVPARRAAIHLDGRPVLTLEGLEKGGDFGLILFQEHYLELMHELCSAYPHYRLDRGTSVTQAQLEGGRVVAVTAKRGGAEERIEAPLFVACTGRNTALRKQVGAEVQVLEPSFDIWWMRFDAPRDPALLPDGFRAYLVEDAMFILYRTYDGRLQLAWGKRREALGRLGDGEELKRLLLREIPDEYREMVATQLGAATERQLLRVACDRLRRWHVPGLLFLGDAAHTMSPVAGQGINIAMRDSIVAANHLIAAAREGKPWDSELCGRIEAERRPEVEAMQRFQVRLGYLLLGAPRWQSRLVFRFLMPVLSALGIRQHFVRRVQGGVTRVELRYPVTLSQVKATGAAARELPA